MDWAITTHTLTKTFERPEGWRRWAKIKPVTAVSDVTLEVPRGELFGLLGPNGAGKTTLVKMLCTLILPTRGSATVAGYALSEAGKIRAATGLVVTDERSFYWRLSGYQNLRFFAALHGLDTPTAERRVRQVLADVELSGHAHERFNAYSSGMKQRLAIARSLLHQPQILFLDEPSRSLDPLATLRLHELILRLRVQQKVTIFLITHDLSEAEKLCRRVALMVEGRIRALGRPADLRRQLQRQIRYTLHLPSLSAEAHARLQQLVPGCSLQPMSETVRVQFSTAEKSPTLTAVLDFLRASNHSIDSIEAQPPSLEEVFQHYTAGEK